MLLAQLSTSLSLRWPQMPYVAHVPGAWFLVRQASGLSGKSALAPKALLYINLQHAQNFA